ncbi:MAG: PDZ domain-containing protein [Anaerolineae bacterium]
MNNRVLKVLAWLAALCLALGVGAAVGGGVVYRLTHDGHVLPVAKAQETDPESGIVIASVMPESPAAEAGVVRGDILLEMDDEALEHPADLERHLDELEPGDQVKLTVLHGDDLRTLTATLGDRHGRPYLGLIPCDGLPKDIEVHLARPPVIVEVMPDGPAAQAGLQEGDMVIAIDGQTVGIEKDLADLIAEYEPGDTVTLEIERPGEDPRAKEVTVELGQHPEKEGAAYLGVRYSSFPRFEGLRELPLGELDEFEFDVSPFVLPHGEIEQGLIIWRVSEDSPASAAGLKGGDVITAIDGEPVASPQALTDAVAEREPGDEITLTVFRGKEESEMEITLGEHPDEEGKAYLGVWVGSLFHMEPSEGDEGPHRFKFFERPLVPFDEPHLDLDELPRRFRLQWQWPPGEDCEGCPGESI